MRLLYGPFLSAWSPEGGMPHESPRVSGRALLLVGAVAIAASACAEDLKKKENSNALIIAHRNKLKLSASSTYTTFPVSRLIDGKKETSCFSYNNDSVAQGTTPFVKITFPEDVTVSRVTVLGDREPDYPRELQSLIRQDRVPGQERQEALDGGGECGRRHV